MNRIKSTALGLPGLALLAAGTLLAPPSHSQAAGSTCPAGGFDVCFPNLDAGAPNAACNPTEEDAPAITACLRQVCRSQTAEPEPGFFNYCCARGSSAQYDDFCVFVVQTACPAVADHCVDRCPPLALLTGTVTIAPPPAACIAKYPTFVASLCEQDPFCCSTSWDSLCAGEGVALRDAEVSAPDVGAAK